MRSTARRVRSRILNNEPLSDDSVDIKPLTKAEKHEKRKRKRDHIDDAEVVRVAIQDERHGYTNVTSWWGNGDPGPLVYIYPENKISTKKIPALNKKIKGEVFIMTSGKDNNRFADGDNTISMFENAYGPAFARNRKCTR